MVDSPGHTVAGIPLLETKLYIPKWRAGLVSRPRLIDRLHGSERKLTLVSAPAGFGKTTLLAEWLAAAPAGERPVGWVSLDQGDNDPAIFWAYFISALQRIQPGVGATALSLLNSPQPPPIESVLTTLINEVNAIEDDFTLILDDFHVIDVQPVHSAVAYILDHLPPTMHLVIASRSDPPLPLPRLRARGELIELRAADLRFSPEEAAGFLNEVMGLEVSPTDVATLEARTEGWIAGLQLAALSMQGREDASGFVAAFSGDDRYIVDYLVEEVLQRQPERVRTFLLQTSILDRLSGPLCDAVTDQEGGSALLEDLVRGNLFVVALDDKRHWYRYHHLFATVLQAYSMEEQPERVPTLHRRASNWYEHNGLLADAVRHALAAKDFERAADLAELSVRAMFTANQESTWVGWVQALPSDLVHNRPVLSVYYIMKDLVQADPHGADVRLEEAEQLLGTSTELVFVNEQEFQSLPGAISIARACCAGAVGDVPGSVKYARRAVDLLPEDDHLWRGVAAALLGIAHWANGDLEAAYNSATDGIAHVRKAGDVSATISITYLLAEIRVAQGRLREAVDACQHALQLAADHGEPTPQGTADVHVELSEIHRERGDLETATQHLLKSKELGEPAGSLERRHCWCIAKARINQARGDMDAALEMLAEAERAFVESPAPDVRPISAWRARVLVSQGKLAEALDWARRRKLSADDELSYMREFEHITLARLLLAKYRNDKDVRTLDEAMGLLRRLLQAAQNGERKGSAIEIMALQALAHRADNDISAAMVPLEHALNLGEPEGYVRIFVDEGDDMRDLLRTAAASGISGPYTRHLLSAFDQLPPVSTQSQGAAVGLVVPLTRRETEILQVIAAGRRNQEIADQLFISLATVKRHVANVYRKLAVSHRTEAIARAHELNLLPPRSGYSHQ